MSLILMQARPPLAVAPTGSVIRRDAYVQLQNIDAMLREAEASAARLVTEARERAEDVRSAAYADGLRQGREAALTAILGTIEIERRMIDLLADRIGRVVEQCIRSLIGQVGVAELYHRRIQHAVSNLTPDSHATLHVAPGQAHLAQEALTQLAERSGADLRWIVVCVDEHCPADEFVIETHVGFVDSRLATTLQDARRIIEQAIRRAAEQLPPHH